MEERVLYVSWTMVESAHDAAGRFRALLYLLCLRYEAGAEIAGATFRREVESGNQLCEKVMNELRAEINSPALNLGIGSLISEAKARKYLTNLLHAFDSPEIPKNFDGGN